MRVASSCVGTVGVDADPVAGDVGPHAPVRQAAIRGDVESGKSTSERLGHDQRGVVRRHDHAVREREVIDHVAGVTVGRDERDFPGAFPLARTAAKSAKSKLIEST